MNYTSSCEFSLFKCHGDKTCYEIRPFENESFLTCGHDGCVKFIDLRQYSDCKNPSCFHHNLLTQKTAITCMAVNPLMPHYFTCGSIDGVLCFYDFRMLSVGSSESKEFISNKTDKGLYAVFDPFMSTEKSNSNAFPVNTKRITSVEYDEKGCHVLANFQPNFIYLLNSKVVQN